MAKAKKKAKKKKAAAAAPPTRCEQGGGEIHPPGPIRVRTTEVVTFLLVICRTAADVRVDLDGVKIVEQLDVMDEVAVTLPAMGPGIHTLLWGARFSGPDWQTRAEVAASGVVNLRIRKSATGSAWPFNHGMAVFEVVA